MPFRPNSSELPKNNARNIKYMAVLIFQQFFDFEQVSEVRDSEMPILGQAPDMVNTVKKKQQPLATFFQRFSDEKSCYLYISSSSWSETGHHVTTVDQSDMRGLGTE